MTAEAELVFAAERAQRDAFESCPWNLRQRWGRITAQCSPCGVRIVAVGARDLISLDVSTRPGAGSSCRPDPVVGDLLTLPLNVGIGDSSVVTLEAQSREIWFVEKPLRSRSTVRAMTAVTRIVGH